MKYLLSFIILALIALTIFSCGVHNYTYTKNPLQAIHPFRIMPVYVDRYFSNDDRVSIEDACNQWNYSMNNYVMLNIITYTFDMEPSVIQEALHNDGLLIMKINADSTLVIPHTDGRITLAYADQVGGHKIYVIRDRLQTPDMTGIMLHELGHILGAEHDNKSYLMQELYNRDDFQCIDKRSALEVARYQRIPEDHINYCIR